MNYMNATLKSLLISYKSNALFVVFLFFMNYMESNRFPLKIIGYYMENNEFTSGFFMLSLKVILYLIFVTFAFDLQFKNMLEKGIYLSSWKHFLKQFAFFLIYYFSLFILVVYCNDLVFGHFELSPKSILYEILDDLMILINNLIIAIIIIKIVNNERFGMDNLKNYFSRDFFYLVFFVILLKTILVILCKYNLILIYQMDFGKPFNVLDFFNTFQANRIYKIINAGLNTLMIFISYCGILKNYKMSQIINSNLQHKV